MLLYRKTAYFGGEISPDGATEHRQRWSAADPPHRYAIKYQAPRGRRKTNRCPSSLRDFVVFCHFVQGLRFAPPLPVFCRPFGAWLIRSHSERYKNQTHTTQKPFPYNAKPNSERCENLFRTIQNCVGWSAASFGLKFQKKCFHNNFSRQVPFVKR